MDLDPDDRAVVEHKRHETELRRRKKRNVTRKKTKLWQGTVVSYSVSAELSK